MNEPKAQSIKINLKAIADKLQWKIIEELKSIDMIIQEISGSLDSLTFHQNREVELKMMKDELDKVKQEMRESRGMIALVRTGKREKEIESSELIFILEDIPYHTNKKLSKETDQQIVQVCYCLLQEINPGEFPSELIPQVKCQRKQ